MKITYTQGHQHDGNMMKVTQGRYDSFGVEGTEQGAPELGIGIASDLVTIDIDHNDDHSHKNYNADRQ